MLRFEFAPFCFGVAKEDLLSRMLSNKVGKFRSDMKAMPKSAEVVKGEEFRIGDGV